jgi:hypothetical protein
MSFNASIQVTELLMKTLENAAKDMASRCVKELASKHNFNAEEAIKDLGLENLSLVRKQMAKKGRGKSLSVSEKKSVTKKETFPMPFIEECVDIAGCQGLNYNRGLFTQCEKKCMENGNFCKSCQKESDGNTNGKPNCGTVSDRVSVGLYDFKDSKGRSPTAYLKVLNKMKLSLEDALSNAGKLNITIPSEHLNPLPEKKSVSKGTRGRPKKTQVIKADNITDLFENLTSDEAVIEDTESNNGSETSNESGKRAKLTDEEKAAKKAALEAERAQKKAEKEKERADKEAKRKAEAEIKKAEREAKLAQEKAEREAKRAQEKAEKEAKRAQEKAQKELEKAAKKAGKENTTQKPVVAQTPVSEKPVAETPVSEKPAAESVKARTVKINGVVYLITADNTLYNPQTKDAVGVWNSVTKQIDTIPEEEEEEEVFDDENQEEEYDE